MIARIEPCDMYRKIFDSTQIAIESIDLKGRFTMVNNAWCDCLAYTKTEAIALSHLEISPEEDRVQAQETFNSLCKGELSSLTKHHRYVRADGRKIWVDLHLSPLKDAGGNIFALLGAFVNVDKEVKFYHKLEDMNEVLENIQEQMLQDSSTITKLNEELKTAYAAMEALARKDTLTGLSNRREMDEILEREISRSRRSGSYCAVAIADIDNFKHVNDAFGHDCGDVVLQQVASVLHSAIRTTDYVGRWGGEEFLFVLADTDFDGVAVVIQRILFDIRALKVCYGTDCILPRLSIGLCFRVKDMNTVDTIVEADKALYIAKKNGKDQVSYSDLCNILR